MLLSSFFQSANLQPDIYYRFLDDIREDHFIGGIDKVCREVKELYPNTNLVATIREKCEEFALEAKQKEKLNQERKSLGYEEPDYDAIEKQKAEWNALKQKLAKERGV